MGARVPVRHYSIRSSSADSYISSNLHDLNSADSSPREIEGIGDVDRDAVTEDSLDNGEETNSVDCLQESYRNSIRLHNVGVVEDRSGLDNSGHLSRSPYNVLTIDDVVPIESARARFLEIFVDNFINEHVIETENTAEVENNHDIDRLNKRKQKEIQYEGDASFVLPLMYVANLYETLVNDVNTRLASLDGIREKTIGVALEASGGLYRKLSKKFPRKGPRGFKRRELATSLETRTRFPELVVQEEKRVRFVVVNGLEIVEKPNSMTIEDAEWFKRLTGRHEVAISARDYKFYSPRHKYRRVPSISVSNSPGLPAYSCSDDSSTLAAASGFRLVNEQQNQHEQSKHHIQSLPHQTEYHPLQQSHHQPIHQNQQFSHTHQCPNGSSVSEISNPHQPPPVPQHMTCIQSFTGGHVGGGRLHLLATSPAKFCDQCGTPYLRETSKFCSECGVKRLGI